MLKKELLIAIPVFQRLMIILPNELWRSFTAPFVVERFPIRIKACNQFVFPGSIPIFQFFFPCNGLFYIFEIFEVNETVAVVFPCKSIRMTPIGVVLYQTPGNIVGHPDVEGGAVGVGDDVDEVLVMHVAIWVALTRSISNLDVLQVSSLRYEMTTWGIMGLGGKTETPAAFAHRPGFGFSKSNTDQVRAVRLIIMSSEIMIG